MKKKLKMTLAIVLILLMLFSTTAFASSSVMQICRDAGIPRLSGLGGVASCKATVSSPGNSIDATLELYQGTSLVNSWHKTGNGYVSFSETANYTSGLSYTLVISGTIDGVEFTPQSITKTLW